MRHRSMFSIKKLQDAYDCDLDLRDTVSSIFASETDPTMRMIKVVPAFVGRDFSVPITTHLRPANAQKRARQHDEEPASKRLRIEQLGNERDHADPSRDQPFPSTEHSRNGSREHVTQHTSHTGSLARRSTTADSLLFMHDAQTGQAEFAPKVKQEPSPPMLPPPQVKKTKALQNGRRGGRSRESSSRHPSSNPPPADSQCEMGGITGPTNGMRLSEQLQDFNSQNHVPETQIEQEHQEEQDQDQEQGLSSAKTPTLRSPQSTPLETRPTSSRATRNDQEVPSSPDFVQQSKNTPKTRTTYSRTPRTAKKRKDLYEISSSPEETRSTALTGRSSQISNHMQSETKLLNASRLSTSDDQYEKMKAPELRKIAMSRGLPANGHSKTLRRLIREHEVLHHASTSQAPWSPTTPDKQKSPLVINAEAPPAGTNGPDPESDSGSDLVPARKPDATSRSRSGSAAGSIGPEQQEDVEMEDAEQMIQAELNGHARSGPDAADDAKLDTSLAPVAGSRSQSLSAAGSTRSSPAVLRRPARYLSRSPSREELASGSESNEKEKSKSPQRTPPTVEVEEIDNDDESSEESSTDEEDEVEESAASTEVPPAAKTTTASQDPPSSPPSLPLTASQTPLPSRPTLPLTVRQTPIPLPSNLSRSQSQSQSQAPQSSQSVSAHTAATRPKLAGRRSEFPSLSELVADTKKRTTPVVQKKVFDPRSMSLNKLTGKVLKGDIGAWANGNTGGESGSSDEAESESDSD